MLTILSTLMEIGLRHTRLFSVITVVRLNKRKYSNCSSPTDIFLDNLTVEHCTKEELMLLNYYKNKVNNLLVPPSTKDELISNIRNTHELPKNTNLQELINFVERCMKKEGSVPNTKLNFYLVYFAKSGNTNGVRAIQELVKKYNYNHFKLRSGYNHYLAQALWINGKLDDSIKLFSDAYGNLQVQQRVRIMLICLFPLLITQHSEGKLRYAINRIQRFCKEKEDNTILAHLWKELFMSNWFSDHQLAAELLEKNVNLNQVVQWMIPTMGKELLISHKVDDFYRLIELTLTKDITSYAGTLLQLLFEYYYIHQNIERCSAVVKYSSSYGFSLTEEQHRKYVDLLLKSKNSVSSKMNVKKQQNVKYKF